MAQVESLVVAQPPPSGFDSYTDEVRRDPYPYYRWLLKHDPVHKGAQGLWYVARHSDVRLVMSDSRFGREGSSKYWGKVIGPGPLYDVKSSNIFFVDPPDHTRLRDLIQGAFTTRVVKTMPARISEIVDDLIGAVSERGHMDVIRDFAYPLPLTVICELLGIPAQDRDQVRSWSMDIAPTADPVPSADVIGRGHAAAGAFAEYLLKHLARLRRAPRDDLLSALLDTSDGQMTEDEIVTMAVTLVSAGHETTTHLIGNGLLALLRHPDQMAILQDNPDLVRSAVEECLRYDSPVQQNPREVQQDVELRGTTLRRGEILIALQGAANRDPAEFDDPDRFDITRRPNRHVSFGHGMRFCVGGPLARLEGNIAFGVLAKRLRNLRLAVSEAELKYQPTTLFRGLTSLPITFETA